MPGTAWDITAIFLAMTLGLACGMGYIVVAAAIGVLVCALFLLRGACAGRAAPAERELKITIPENLDYAGLFDDLFEHYTSNAKLMQVKTANLGSLYKLCYQIRLKDERTEKELIDHLRCRNGNLEIVCGRIPAAQDML